MCADFTPNSEEPRFMMDHMVIRLGKYLRALGYDAIWKRDIRTHELILAANRDDRWFVTRNTRLEAEYPQPHKLALLHSDSPVQQLNELRTILPNSLFEHPFTRCIRCNVPIEPIKDKNAVRDRVHPNVFVRYERFFSCPHCGTVFWRGSHVRNTCRKLGIPDQSEFTQP